MLKALVLGGGRKRGTGNFDILSLRMPFSALSAKHCPEITSRMFHI